MVMIYASLNFKHTIIKYKYFLCSDVKMQCKYNKGANITYWAVS